MYKPNQTKDLPETLMAEIELNSQQMNRFYTLPVHERDDLLERICRHNSPQELKRGAKMYRRSMK